MSNDNTENKVSTNFIHWEIPMKTRTNLNASEQTNLKYVYGDIQNNISSLFNMIHFFSRALENEDIEPQYAHEFIQTCASIGEGLSDSYETLSLRQKRENEKPKNLDLSHHIIAENECINIAKTGQVKQDD